MTGSLCASLLAASFPGESLSPFLRALKPADVGRDPSPEELEGAGWKFSRARYAKNRAIRATAMKADVARNQACRVLAISGAPALGQGYHKSWTCSFQ